MFSQTASTQIPLSPLFLKGLERERENIKGKQCYQLGCWLLIKPSLSFWDLGLIAGHHWIFFLFFKFNLMSFDKPKPFHPENINIKICDHTGVISTFCQFLFLRLEAIKPRPQSRFCSPVGCHVCEAWCQQ